MENDSGGSSDPAAESAMMEDRQMQDEPMEAGTGAADSMEDTAAGAGQEVPSAAGVVFEGLTNETAGTSGAAQMVAVDVLEAANTTAGRQDLTTDAGGHGEEAGAVSLAAGGAEVEDPIDGRQELGAVALQDDMQAEFNLNPDDFPALERPSSPVGSVDDSDNDDDNMDEPNDSDPEEAMDDALENFDDDDEEDDDMDDAMLDNGVPFIHVFSPRQQLDSDNDNNNTDDEDSQQLEQFDISLPGQHLYIPADEAADEPIDPPPALPLLPPPPPDEDPP
ncbi:ribonuclease E, partial [Hyalella azteca]|uniref:Ribonuclease E n=1 Tax=Hyalella azteca TaxID=294128 RepID=A0A8B7PP97_HYAAZ